MGEIRQIAKIESTWLGYEDHGIFSINVTFSYGSSSQGTGHYAIASEEFQTWDAVGVRIIRAIIDACGVAEWSKVTGRTVYAVREDDQWNAKIVGIAPLPTEKGKEFRFADIFDSVKEEAVA